MPHCIAFTNQGAPCKNFSYGETPTCYAHRNYFHEKDAQIQFVKFLEKARQKLFYIADMKHRYCTEDKNLSAKVLDKMAEKKERMQTLLYDPVDGVEALMRRHRTEDVRDELKAVQKQFSNVSRGYLSLITKNCKGKKMPPYVVRENAPTPEEVVQLLERGDDDSLQYAHFLMTFTQALWRWVIWGLVKTPTVAFFIYNHQKVAMVIAAFVIINQPWVGLAIGRRIPIIRNYIKTYEIMLEYYNSGKKEVEDLRQLYSKNLFVVEDLRAKVNSMFKWMSRILSYGSPDTFVKLLQNSYLVRNFSTNKGKSRKELRRVDKQLEMGADMWAEATQHTPRMKDSDFIHLESSATYQEINLYDLHTNDPRVHFLELAQIRPSRNDYNEDVLPMWTFLGLALFTMKRFFRV